MAEWVWIGLSHLVSCYSAISGSAGGGFAVFEHRLSDIEKLFRQFWFLEGDPRDQIPFLLTADRLILEQTRFLEVAALLRDFEQFYPEKLSHLPGIADALTELADAPDTAGACFVWTTCSTDAWMVPDDGYHRRYRHPDDQEQYGSFFLFDELQRCQSLKNQEPERNPV